MNWIENLYHLEKWKKHSQANEESYLKHILDNIDKKTKYLVDIGAWDGYHLSNTRYFLEEEGYRGILIDADGRGNSQVKEHFVTKENIISILKKYKCLKEFDLLCIDVDGNDIYILDEILTYYSPKLIIAEFNPIFKKGESFTITYDENHSWGGDTYYGFSFSAGMKMAEKNNYTCIFQNDDLNMYFLRNDLLNGLSVPEVNYNEGAIYHPYSTKNTWLEYK